MAEKYGEKPRKFSAKWFEYIWNYYKWFIIAVIAVVALACVTVYQIRKTPKYDVILTVAGDYLYGDDEVMKIEEILNNICDDINGDGKVMSDIYQLTYVGDETVDSAYDTRFILQLQEEDMLLYLMDKERFDRIIAESFGDEIFTPLSEWYSGSMDGENIYYYEGKPYGIKISSSKIFRENGINDGDLYVAVRKNYRSHEKKLSSYMIIVKKLLIL